MIVDFFLTLGFGVMYLVTRVLPDAVLPDSIHGAIASFAYWYNTLSPILPIEAMIGAIAFLVLVWSLLALFKFVRFGLDLIPFY